MLSTSPELSIPPSAYSIIAQISQPYCGPLLWLGKIGGELSQELVLLIDARSGIGIATHVHTGDELPNEDCACWRCSSRYRED